MFQVLIQMISTIELMISYVGGIADNCSTCWGASPLAVVGSYGWNGVGVHGGRGAFRSRAVASLPNL
jgi:hypothetical protein